MAKGERELHRKLGARCFNEAWKYLEKSSLDKDEIPRLLNLAHASYYHWDIAGTDRNRAIALWQTSKAYSLAGEPSLATLFAKKGLAVARRSKLDDLVPSMEEALADAYATGGDRGRSRRYLMRARDHLENLRLGKEDRDVFLGQIERTESKVRGSGPGRR